MLMFREQDRGRVAAGEITVSYRLWSRAQVKAGKQYETGFGRVEVTAVDVMPAAMVSEIDVPRTGLASIAEIWALAGDHTKTRVDPETLLYRVEFRFVG
jgi:hypothetical protein